jgi:predicted aspartyl protease
MKNITVIIMVIIISASPIIAQEQLSDPVKTTLLKPSQAEIPIKIINGHIYIDVKINGKGPFLFLLDTGASGNGRIDITLAKSLGINSFGNILNDDGTGKNAKILKKMIIDSLQIGEAKFSNLLLYGNDYSKKILTSKSIDGIIGFYLFSDLLWTIDYPNKKLIFKKGSLNINDFNTIKYNTGLNGKRCFIPVSLRKLNIFVNLDTGNQGGLTMASKLQKELRFTNDVNRSGWAETSYNSHEIYSAYLIDPLKIGGHTVNNIKAYFAKDWGKPNIGYKILSKFRITFDSKNQLVHFTRE